MKKLLLAATVLAGIAFNASAAETIRFASSATYPPSNRWMPATRLSGLISIWLPRCASK
jgi:hypothetical protein